MWENTKIVTNPEWAVTLNVPNEEEFVDIKIQLWDWNPGVNKICDISGDSEGYLDSFDVELTYSIKTGHWWEDDYAYYEPAMFDPSGYGRLNGCDDNSIYENDRDCELWFDIYQNDYEDGIPMLNDCLAFNRKYGLDSLSNTINELANVYIEIGKLDEAKDLLKEAEERTTIGTYKNPLNQMRAYHLLGKLDLKLRNYEQAKRYIEESRKI